MKSSFTCHVAHVPGTVSTPGLMAVVCLCLYVQSLLGVLRGVSIDNTGILNVEMVIFQFGYLCIPLG